MRSEEIGLHCRSCAQKSRSTRCLPCAASLDEEGNLHEAFHEIKAQAIPATAVDHAKIWEVVPDDA